MATSSNFGGKPCKMRLLFISLWWQQQWWSFHSYPLFLMEKCAFWDFFFIGDFGLLFIWSEKGWCVYKSHERSESINMKYKNNNNSNQGKWGMRSVKSRACFHFPVLIINSHLCMWQTGCPKFPIWQVCPALRPPAGRAGKAPAAASISVTTLREIIPQKCIANQWSEAFDIPPVYKAKG